MIDSRPVSSVTEITGRSIQNLLSREAKPLANPSRRIFTATLLRSSSTRTLSTVPELTPR